MYQIADYDKRYKPTNKSGGELKWAEWVKLPAKPKGDGLQTLLERKRGLEVFAVWCLLLEKTTQQKPQNRGKLLNFCDEPATVAEIAMGISLKNRVDLVNYALSVLVELKWVIFQEEKEGKNAENAAEQSSEEFRKGAPKSSKGKLSKGKVKEGEGTSAKQKFHDFVFLTSEEHKKLLQRYGDKNTRKLIDSLNRYIGSKGVKYKSHYFTLLNFAKRDGMPELKPSKQTAESHQQALEKKQEEMRRQWGQVYRDKTTEQLKELYKAQVTHRWLITEILKERKQTKGLGL